MNRCPRGYTLVELMVVVTLFSIFAWLAIVSIGRSNRYEVLDGFAGDVRTMMLTARRRAVATRNVYLVSVVNQGGSPPSHRVTMCQMTTNPDAITPTVLSGLSRSCASSPPAGREQSRHLITQNGVEVDGWAKDVDLGQGAARSSFPASIFFLPDGTADSDLRIAGLQGYSLFLQGSSRQGSGEFMRQRKIVVYPFSGRPRITDAW